MRRLVAVLMIGALIGSSCSDENEGSSSAPSTVVDSRLLDLAGLFPRDTAGTSPLAVLFGDWEQAQLVLDVELDCSTADTMAAGIAELTRPGTEGGAGPSTPFPGQFPPLTFGAEWTQLETEFGFNACDINGFAEVIRGVPDLAVVDVSRAPDVVLATIADDPVWGPDLTVTPTESGSLLDWGEDGTKIHMDRTSRARRLGRGGFVHVGSDGLILRTVESETMTSALDAVSVSDTLADDETVQAILSALANEGAYGVLLVDPKSVDEWLATNAGLGPERLNRITQFFDESPLPGPANWMAGAWSVQDGTVRVWHVSGFAGEDEAEANRPRIEDLLTTGEQFTRPLETWADLFPDVTVEQTGALVIARSVYPIDGGESPDRFLASYVSDDTLFLTANS